MPKKTIVQLTQELDKSYSYSRNLENEINRLKAQVVARGLEIEDIRKHLVFARQVAVNLTQAVCDYARSKN